MPLSAPAAPEKGRPYSSWFEVSGVSLSLMEPTQSQALQDLAHALDELPGAFGGEGAVVYHAGVSEGVEHWSCDIEADIPSSNVQAWGHTRSKPRCCSRRLILVVRHGL